MSHVCYHVHQVDDKLQTSLYCKTIEYNSPVTSPTFVNISNTCWHFVIEDEDIKDLHCFSMKFLPFLYLYMYKLQLKKPTDVQNKKKRGREATTTEARSGTTSVLNAEQLWKPALDS